MVAREILSSRKWKNEKMVHAGACYTTLGLASCIFQLGTMLCVTQHSHQALSRPAHGFDARFGRTQLHLILGVQTLATLGVHAWLSGLLEKQDQVAKVSCM